jgi:hypothetical protein
VNKVGIDNISSYGNDCRIELADKQVCGEKLMHCIVLSSPAGKDAWRVHRSVEILAYHRDAKRISILFILLVENLLPSKNELRVLHRGNVECNLVPSWPLPLHRDEEAGTRGVLNDIYGTMFRKDGENLLRVKKLTSWDAQENIEGDVSIADWAVQTGLLSCSDEASFFPPEIAPLSKGNHVPFTTWMFSPFHQSGFHLLSFRLQFEGLTYDRLVPNDDIFTVDGPERLLARIEYEDIIELSSEEKKSWRLRLEEFEDPEKRLLCENYDVIILGPPHGDAVARVTEYNANGIYPAPRQSGTNAQRFITTNNLFTLPLMFAAETTTFEAPETTVAASA